ncbi:MAG TPA: methyltransferase domain-containing protein, partial [Chitinophagaceae bacterium]|nr:methyltransferase domain-containing protein [Chitinophagaceae bacterium]
VLILYRFRGRWQLSAASALYSDGPAYRPLTTAFGYLGQRLSACKEVLVLGAGLGSAAAILHQRKVQPQRITLLDIDPQVIAWGKQTLETIPGTCYEWICADVQAFAAQQGQHYDLLIVDVFQDRIVPAFVTTSAFLQQCKRLLQPSTGIMVLNYIINNEQAWEASLLQLRAVFTVEHMIKIGINRILILKSNA